MYSMLYNWESPAKSKSDTLTSILNSIAKRVGRFRSSLQNTNNSISEVPVFHQTKASTTEIPPELKATITRMCIKAATKLISSQKNIIEKADQYGIEYQLDLTESPRWNDFVDSIYEYEDLLEQAKELNINWNESVYAPMALSRKIKKVILQQEQSDISDLYTPSITRVEV